MSKNKYKNNEPLNRKGAGDPSEQKDSEVLEPGPLEEPPEVAGVDPDEDPRQEELKTRMPEEKPEVVDEDFERVEEKPRIDKDHADILSKPDYREHNLHLESHLEPPQDPDQVFAGDQMNRINKNDISDARRDTRPTLNERRGREVTKGFPWWWILLPLILLALIYGLTRNPTPPADEPSGTTTTFDDQGPILSSGSFEFYL